MSDAEDAAASQREEERRKRLLNLRSKINQARNLNTEAANEEYRRKTEGEAEVEKREKQEAWEKKKRQRASDEAEGIVTEGAAKELSVTASSAEDLRKKRRRKDKHAASSGWDMFNVDTQIHTYKKRLRHVHDSFGDELQSKYEKDKESFEKDPTKLEDLQYCVVAEPTDEMRARMKQELTVTQSRRSTFSRRRAFNDEKDVDYINDRYGNPPRILNKNKKPQKHTPTHSLSLIHTGTRNSTRSWAENTTSTRPRFARTWRGGLLCRRQKKTAVIALAAFAHTRHTRLCPFPPAELSEGRGKRRKKRNRTHLSIHTRARDGTRGNPPPPKKNIKKIYIKRTKKNEKTAPSAFHTIPPLRSRACLSWLEYLGLAQPSRQSFASLQAPPPAAYSRLRQVYTTKPPLSLLDCRLRPGLGCATDPADARLVGLQGTFLCPWRHRHRLPSNGG